MWSISKIGFGSRSGIFMKTRFVRGFGFDFYPEIRFGFGFGFGIFQNPDSDSDSDSVFFKNKIRIRIRIRPFLKTRFGFGIRIRLLKKHDSDPDSDSIFFVFQIRIRDSAESKSNPNLKIRESQDSSDTGYIKETSHQECTRLIFNSTYRRFMLSPPYKFPPCLARFG